MKKFIFLTVAALAVAVSANAQNRFSKGDWYMGAWSTDLGLNHSFGADVLSGTSFNVQGFGGYFFANRFAVDALVGLSVRKVEGFKATTSAIFGAGVRYYPVGNLFARVGYKGETGSGSDLASLVDIQVGYDLFLTENVYFEPALYYSTRLDAKASGLGLSIGVGVRF